jgi:hypothetical protein
MTEQVPENDFRKNAQDMTPEANADVSRGHLLRWSMEHHLVHFNDGEMVIGEIATDKDKSTEVVLHDSHNTISLREAGERKPKLWRWPRAS